MLLTQQLVQFFSSSLVRIGVPFSSFQRSYSAFDRKLLAAYFAIKHFRHFVEGHSFHTLTDHKPLTYALQKNSDRLSPFRKAQILTCNSDSHNGSRDHLHIRPKEFHTHYVTSCGACAAILRIEKIGKISIPFI